MQKVWNAIFLSNGLPRIVSGQRVTAVAGDSMFGLFSTGLCRVVEML